MRRAPAGPVDLRGERSGGGLSELRGGELGLVMAVAVASLVPMTMVWPAEPFFVLEDLDAGALGYGLITAAWTAGMALGASRVAPALVKRSIGVVALVAVAIQGAALAGPTLWLSPIIAAAFFAIGGVAHGVKNVSLRSMLQQGVPADRHGRAAAAFNGARNGAELLALASGAALVELIGSRTTLTLAGVLPVVIALVGLAALRRRQRPVGSAGPARAVGRRPVAAVPQRIA